MSNETCEANEGGRRCNQPAVALVSQTTHESKGQPAKTISNYMCKKHAEQIKTTNKSSTVTPL
jgi:hypothetical protein